MFLYSEIPFAKDKTHRLLPHMLAVMVCFVSLLCAFSSDIYGYVKQQSSRQSTYLYIEIPAYQDMSIKEQERIKRSVDALVTENLSEAVWLDKEEVEALLTPWLGEGLPLDTLPLPQLIEVNLFDNPQEFNAETLQTKLSEIHAGIQLDVEQPWRGQFTEGGYVLMRIMLIAALALFAVAVSFVSLLARTHFQLHEHVLELLRRIGARDDYITKQFQRHNLHVTMRGALLGSATGLILYGVWHLLDVGSLIGISAGAPTLLLSLSCFCLLPLMLVAACLWGTQLSVKAQLKESF